MSSKESMPMRLLTMKEVVSRVALSKATIYARIVTGDFPKQISLGGNRVAWLESQIDEWINERVACSTKNMAA